jgi:hypothetical protein
LSGNVSARVFLSKVNNMDFPQIIGGIAGSCMFVYIMVNFFVGMFSSSVEPINLSEIELGYIKETAEELPTIQTEDDELKVLERRVKIAKLKMQLEELEGSKTKSIDETLLKDCIDVVIGLGTSKRKAKAEVEIIFENNPEIKSVQQFITEYGKR